MTLVRRRVGIAFDKQGEPAMNPLTLDTQSSICITENESVVFSYSVDRISQ